MNWKVSAKEHGLKVLAFIQSRINHELSNRAIKKAIDSGRCQRNGKKELFASSKVRKGDKISFVMPVSKGRKPPITLFEDQYILVINKPCGLICDVKSIQRHVGKTIATKLIHRLDKETTGVLIIPKTDDVLEAFIELFAKRQMEKIYLAIVEGVPEKESGTIESYLVRERDNDGRLICYSGEKSEGSLAITSWKILSTCKGGSLLECRPQTGKTHQIRVHLSDLGHPVLGDVIYGDREGAGSKAIRTLLHAKSYSFIHPFTDKKLTFEAETPEDMVI